MSQTSYAQSMSAAYEGGHQQLQRARSGRNNLGSEIGYGRFVAFDAGAGTSELAFRLPTGSTDKILGVTLYDHAHEPQVTGIPDDGMASICEQGDVWVITEQAVTPADPVFIRYNIAGATGTSPALGKVRLDADTAKAVAAPNCQFMTSAAAGGLVLVRCNLP